MKLEFYKIFVKDLSISDEELEQILQQIIIDIAQNTYIFKDTVVFNVFEHMDFYDMKVIYETSDVGNYNADESDIKDVSNPDLVVNELLYEAPKLHLEIQKDDIVYKTNMFLACSNIVNMLPINGRNENYKASMIIDYPVFKEVSDNVFKVNRELLCQLFECKIRDKNQKLMWNDKLQFVAYCNVIPDWRNIDDDLEIQIRQALIDGLKYYASSTYLNAQNEQVSNILYQRYYAKLRQLKYNNPNMLVNSIERKNASWNY